MTAPLHVIRPIGDRSFPDFAEVWRFRDLCAALGRRDVTLRYRQTMLGVIWVVLQPVIAGGLFSVVFGKVAKLPSEGRPYFVFAYAGFVAWSAFQNTLTRASGSLLAQSNLVTKVYFPRLVLPISALLSAAVDFMVALGSLAVVLALFRVAPGLPLLMLPVWILLLHVMGLGLGTLVAALSVRFRDLQHALPVLTQLLMYASPVAYAISAVPGYLRPYFLLNPMSGMLDGFRWSVLGTAPPGAMAVAFSVAGAVAAVAAGSLVFARFERRLADVI
ncbi:MAG: ABC transporter permease [Gemmatimonadales bacterium]